MVPPPPPPVKATPFTKYPPDTFTDPDVVLPAVAAPTVRILFESVEPPMLFDVALELERLPPPEIVRAVVELEVLLKYMP